MKKLFLTLIAICGLIAPTTTQPLDHHTAKTMAQIAGVTASITAGIIYHQQRKITTEYHLVTKIENSDGTGRIDRNRMDTIGKIATFLHRVQLQSAHVLKAIGAGSATALTTYCAGRIISAS